MDMTTYLVCPGCHIGVVRTDSSFVCSNCGQAYPLCGDVPQFDLRKPNEAWGDSVGRDERREYWDHGWEARFHGDHGHLQQLKSRAQWEAYLKQQQETLRAYGHVSQIEAGQQFVQDKLVLDIGCGGGISSAFFGYFGAHYIGVDHSPTAAAQALRHLHAVQGDGFTVQGNAEFLPIRSESVDVVYSNGVLHHTPNFSTAMDEVYRVLKPGGKAIIAVYSTYSTGFGRIRLHGALTGHISRRAMERWMGRKTEGAWRTDGRLNPWTQTFSKRRLRNIVRKYGVREFTFRKNGNPIGEIPRFGRKLMRFRSIRKLDRTLEPLLGSMCIVTFDK